MLIKIQVSVISVYLEHITQVIMNAENVTLKDVSDASLQYLEIIQTALTVNLGSQTLLVIGNMMNNHSTSVYLTRETWQSLNATFLMDSRAKNANVQTTMSKLLMTVKSNVLNALILLKDVSSVTLQESSAGLVIHHST